MNILIVSEKFYPELRGGEIVLWRVAKGLAARGYEVRVLTARLGNTKARETASGVEIIRPCKLNAEGKSRTFTALIKKFSFMKRIYSYLKEEIKCNRPDVIYDNAYTAILPAGLAGKKFGLPVVTNVGNLQGLNHLKGGSNPVISILQLIKEILLVRFGGHKAVRVSSSSVEKKVNNIGFEEVFTIPTPIDDQLAVRSLSEVNVEEIREEIGLMEEELFLLYVGAVEKVKNLDSLIRSLSNFSQDFRFILVGDGSELSKLKTLVGELGLSNEVKFLGERDQKRVFELMNAADAFLLPSKSETGPLVVLEALSVQTPVISTNVGIVQELETPNLVVVEEPEEIITVLERGVTSYNDSSILKEFSIENITGQFERMFEAVIENEN